MIFFYSFILIVKLIFLNLFIAIILQGFQDINEQQGRVFNNETAELFRDQWANFDPNASGFIKIFNLPKVLLALDKPLGWDDSFLSNPDQ